MGHSALSLADKGREALFYGGAWQKPHSTARTPTVNPADGTKLGSVVDADEADVDAAVKAAAAAFPAWRATTPAERGKVLVEAARRLRAKSAELAEIDAVDAGLPQRRMVGDVEVAATALEYFAGLVREIKGETVPLGPNSLNYSIREPLGVVVRIHPFNHPIMFAGGKVASALAAGNTVIAKPAEQTPLSTLALAEIWADVFPPGVYNTITGGRPCGAALVAHPKVAKVGLIGSVETGKAVMRSGADSLKKISLELGGKNALIAYPDADPARVAAAAVEGMNLGWTAGQSCGATTRVYLHDGIHDAVVKEMVARLGRVRLGRPTDPDCEMGCLVSDVQKKKVLGYIKSAVEEGAHLAYGGDEPKDKELAGGFFVRPTLFTNVTERMRIAREEIFGPVVSVFRWSDEAAMFKQVNALDYGLAASIWTRDLVKAHHAASAVEAGYVWINNVGGHFLGAPFGGYKHSGVGREECMEELLSYTQLKNVNVSLTG